MSGPAAAASASQMEALRLCVTGDDAAGLALYDSGSGPDRFADARLGFHVHLIATRGSPATAAALRSLLVGSGGDIAWRTAMRPGASAADVAREYEGLFARGFANSVMVGRYACALTRAGRSGDVARIFDFPRRLWCRQVGDAEPVANIMLSDEQNLPHGTRQITHDMSYLAGLQLRDNPVFGALLDEVRIELVRYLSDWLSSDHPLARLVPQDFSIDAWAMIARGEGHNTRHQHPLGWITGVYYPAGLPEDSGGGELRIGGWEDPAPAGWPETSIRPRTGLLVIMPSWYVHWTEPTRSTGARLAIAFDAVPHS